MALQDRLAMNVTEPSMLSQSASISLHACVFGTSDIYLSQQSTVKLMYSCGSSSMRSASDLVNLIRLKQTWMTMAFIWLLNGSLKRL